MRETLLLMSTGKSYPKGIVRGAAGSKIVICTNLKSPLFLIFIWPTVLYLQVTEVSRVRISMCGWCVASQTRLTKVMEQPVSAQTRWVPCRRCKFVQCDVDLASNGEMEIVFGFMLCKG